MARQNFEAFKAIFKTSHEIDLPKKFRSDLTVVDRESLRDDKDGFFDQFIWSARRNGTRLIALRKTKDAQRQISDFGHHCLREDLIHTSGAKFYLWRDGELTELFFEVTNARLGETNISDVLSSHGISPVPCYGE